ncbi:PREDICTED: uncharacterized protein LOC105146565 [Acromyrmex echinatior]|uniref:uncharacterized protein LOC105146565 n=1 Tax=Acromyrmex echinatior TaxID=103372 RepID=UPI000580D5F5|nr:PREDICTED: uncharacterized protein LOC105146565 [Acromyrmex echinatior]
MDRSRGTPMDAGDLPGSPIRGDSVMGNERATESPEEGEKEEKNSAKPSIVIDNIGEPAKPLKRGTPHSDTRAAGTISSARSDFIARRRRRDALTAIARPRRNTWHAENKGDAVTDDDSSRSSRIDVIGDHAERDCALDATNSAGFWNVRIADDDRHTCCVSIDATTFLARRGPARDLIIERRNRRVGSDLLTRSRSIAAGEEIFRSTVNDITIGREDRFFEIPLVGTTDFPECNGRTLSSNTSSIVLHEVNGGSSTTVREIGRPIDSDVNTENLRTSGPRLIEIGIVESSCEEQPCVLAEEIVRRRDTSPTVRFPAKLDPGGRAWRTKTDTRWRLPRIGLVQRTLLLGLLATSLLCDMVLTAPSSSSAKLEMTRNNIGDDELEIIRRSIVQGLGLQRIPDPSKANVSQAEYERAHREYLKQVQLSHDGQKFRTRRDLHVFQAAEHPGNKSSLGFSLRGGYHRHSLYFPVAVSGDAEDVTVDHASLRFLLQGDHRRPRDLEALIYLRTSVSRRLLLRREIPQGEPTGSRWMELDSTEAAASWLEDSLENHGLELEFLHDGQPIRREVSHATLNVFTTSEPGSGRRKRSTPEELMPLHKGRRSRCKGDNNKKCCRHELTVMFKDLKGFEFIVYPKGFDAGYCKGRCPPRYNPAHHHALLQSLLWKEDRKRVPKPCCAPSKLDQLMIVYFDENQSTQLKVSYWKNIQVLECACS